MKLVVALWALGLAVSVAGEAASAPYEVALFILDLHGLADFAGCLLLENLSYVSKGRKLRQDCPWL